MFLLLLLFFCFLSPFSLCSLSVAALSSLSICGFLRKNKVLCLLSITPFLPILYFLSSDMRGLALTRRTLPHSASFLLHIMLFVNIFLSENWYFFMPFSPMPSLKFRNNLDFKRSFCYFKKGLLKCVFKNHIFDQSAFVFPNVIFWSSMTIQTWYKLDIKSIIYCCEF